jgi:hypothetical protein
VTNDTHVKTIKPHEDKEILKYIKCQATSYFEQA